ncbi:hypothetical protein DMC01_02455 [Campylobacter troglodytis]|nr:hypothetical protein DMC01_02455 [Campylobacter troglodytis]
MQISAIFFASKSRLLAKRCAEGLIKNILKFPLHLAKFANRSLIFIGLSLKTLWFKFNSAF